MKIEVFSFADLTAIAGLEQRIARDWRFRGIFRASVQKTGRGGAHLSHSFADVFTAWLARNLRDGGLPINLVKRLTDMLYTAEIGPKSCVAVITDGEVRLTGRAEAMRLSRLGCPVIIDLIRNAAKLRADIDCQHARAAEKATSQIVPSLRHNREHLPCN